MELSFTFPDSHTSSTVHVASSPGFPLLGTKKRAKTEGSLVEFKSRASISVTWMTLNVTRLSVVSRTRHLAAADSVANTLAEFLRPLKLLRDRSALILA